MDLFTILARQICGKPATPEERAYVIATARNEFGLKGFDAEIASLLRAYFPDEVRNASNANKANSKKQKALS